MRRKCPGLKHDTEAQDIRKDMVEEHCWRDEAVQARSCGVPGRENAGMSSEREVGILSAEYPRFPG